MCIRDRLYKAPEIKRAVQGNQAQIGEILLTNFANEDPIYDCLLYTSRCV